MLQSGTSSLYLASFCDVIFFYYTGTIDLDFPIGSSTFSYKSHLMTEWRPSCSLSKQKTEVLPFSVMLTGPHCQSDRSAQQTSAPTLLSHTVGAEKRCQTIWQAKWDIFIRSSAPSPTGAKASWGKLSHAKHQLKRRKPHATFISASRPGLHFLFISL